tara:strand:+ start:10520 stop:10840 length:321 start_codon:yes stop_codon:yes gene_type:complete
MKLSDVKIIKIYTRQSIEYVEQYLKETGLDYSYKNYAFYIDDPERSNVTYQYYYTTGRWGVLHNRRNRRRMHYCCKNIETLVNKYVYRFRCFEWSNDEFFNKLINL